MSSIIYEIKNDFAKMMESSSCAYWLNHQFYHEKYFYSMCGLVERNYFLLKEKYGNHLKKFSQILAGIENILALMEKSNEMENEPSVQIQKNFNTYFYHKHNLEANSSLLLFTAKDTHPFMRKRSKTFQSNSNSRSLFKRATSIEGSSLFKRLQIHNEKQQAAERFIKHQKRKSEESEPKKKTSFSESMESYQTKFVFSKFRKKPKLLTTDKCLLFELDFIGKKSLEPKKEDFSTERFPQQTVLEKHFSSKIKKGLLHTFNNYQLSSIVTASDALKHCNHFDKSEFELGKAILRVKRRENRLIEVSDDVILANSTRGRDKLVRIIRRQCENAYDVIKAEQKVSNTETNARKSIFAKALLFERRASLLDEERISIQNQKVKNYMKTEPSTFQTTLHTDPIDEEFLAIFDDDVNKEFKEAKHSINVQLERNEKENTSYERLLKGNNKRKTTSKAKTKKETVIQNISIMPENLKTLAQSTDLVRFRRVRQSELRARSLTDFVKERIFEKRIKSSGMRKFHNALKKIKFVIRKERLSREKRNL